ncbi:MAG: hypothetical protein ACJ71B_12805, partial [Nitrososphaera sp.]
HFLKRYHFTARRACINFHSNPTVFKADDDSITITGKNMAVKTIDRTFLQGQSAELFRAAIKVEQHATHTK